MKKGAIFLRKSVKRPYVVRQIDLEQINRPNCAYARGVDLGSEIFRTDGDRIVLSNTDTFGLPEASADVVIHSSVKKRARLDFQRFGDLSEHKNRGIADAALDSADVSPVKARFKSQLLLRLPS